MWVMNQLPSMKAYWLCWSAYRIARAIVQEAPAPVYTQGVEGKLYVTINSSLWRILIMFFYLQDCPSYCSAGPCTSLYSRCWSQPVSLSAPWRKNSANSPRYSQYLLSISVPKVTKMTISCCNNQPKSTLESKWTFLQPISFLLLRAHFPAPFDTYGQVSSSLCLCCYYPAITCLNNMMCSSWSPDHLWLYPLSSNFFQPSTFQ